MTLLTLYGQSYPELDPDPDLQTIVDEHVHVMAASEQEIYQRHRSFRSRSRAKHIFPASTKTWWQWFFRQRKQNKV
jgi:hypothetical protein